MSTIRHEAIAAAAQGDAARERGDLTNAIDHYQHVLEIDPNSAYAHYWMATCHEAQGSLDRALGYCNIALARDPTQIALLVRKASISRAMGNALAASECYEQVAALDPAYPSIDALIADQYALLGLPDQAMDRFRRAIAVDPNSTNLRHSLLFVGNYSPRLTPEEGFAEHRRWGEEIEAGIVPMQHSRHRLDSERLLRIAYLSGDLRNHAVATFVEPLLANHDRNRYHVICLDSFSGEEDGVCRRLQGYGHPWFRIGGTSDADVAALIATQAADILIDLAGHSAMNRLGVLARKPAPVQATWLGYLNTTGLRRVDYRITDAWLDPPGMTEHLHTERLLRIPHAACFRPPAEAPPPGELPALRNGYVTYGSLNNWAKTNPVVREQWRTILVANPTSRLRVYVQGGDDPRMANFARDAIAGTECDRARIDVRPTLPLKAFLQEIREIDIGLDTFPYGGGTTTFHSLWMGIPVVTLAGTSALGRNSLGPLETLGLGAYVAHDMDHYAAIAAAMARDPDALADVRERARNRLLASPLTDERKFTRDFEAGLRMMWRTYCEGGVPE